MNYGSPGFDERDTAISSPSSVMCSKMPMPAARQVSRMDTGTGPPATANRSFRNTTMGGLGQRKRGPVRAPFLSCVVALSRRGLAQASQECFWTTSVCAHRSPSPSVFPAPTAARPISTSA